VVHQLLAGKPGPVRDIVILNAAAALVAYGKPSPDDLVAQLRAQMAVAEEAVDSGAAKATLDAWIEATHAS